MVLAAIIGYLIGSFPTAQLLGRRLGVDPLRSGDGNPGWWNMRDLLGKPRARIVLVGDVLKGAVPAAIVGAFSWGDWWWVYVAVGGAMVGHAFPVFAHFRGGRSVLTFVGGVLVAATAPTLVAMALGTLYGAVTKNFAYGARVAMFSFPFVQATQEPRAHVAAAGVLMTFIGLRFLTARTSARARTSPAAVLLE